MITEVYLDDVTSYTSSSKLNPTNKISLIYGLNGAGKSTISNFLYNPTSLQYQKCRIRKNTDSDILVYNQDFLSDYFYEKDSLKGIFTLSKENKTVLQQIDQQNIKLDKLEKSKIALEDDLNKVQVKLQNEKKKAIDNVWKIKKYIQVVIEFLSFV